MMVELNNILKGFTKKEWLGSILFFVVLMTTQIATGSTLIALFASAMGFLYVTLVRKGSRLCYIFGAIQMLLLRRRSARDNRTSGSRRASPPHL